MSLSNLNNQNRSHAIGTSNNANPFNDAVLSVLRSSSSEAVLTSTNSLESELLRLELELLNSNQRVATSESSSEREPTNPQVPAAMSTRLRLLQAHEETQREEESINARIRMLQAQMQPESQTESQPSALASEQHTRLQCIKSPLAGAAAFASTNTHANGHLQAQLFMMQLQLQRQQQQQDPPPPAAPDVASVALSTLQLCQELGMSNEQSLALAVTAAKTVQGSAQDSRNDFTTNNEVAPDPPSLVPGNGPTSVVPDPPARPSEEASSLEALLQLARETNDMLVREDRQKQQRLQRQLQEQRQLQQQKQKVGPRKGRSIMFPITLHSILCTVEREGRSDIATFTPDGSGFIVLKPKLFLQEYLSRHFKYSGYSSFQRQVNLYCFKKRRVGTKSFYSHHNFHRDFPERCREMIRTKIKSKEMMSDAVGELEEGLEEDLE
ncbi:transcription factor [Seminavis robusta]|uniref:Transcription factor n=1 Tax=Seminavis robusta TaxID=568900 RepID=A0A9N8DSN8_9STRA|nr:transcription factor [Seminavis robusta]|eukprot:Sro259_g101490.1 transcription factor (439) ;mRNA; r:81349-82770